MSNFLIKCFWIGQPNTSRHQYTSRNFFWINSEIFWNILEKHKIIKTGNLKLSYNPNFLQEWPCTDKQTFLWTIVFCRRTTPMIRLKALSIAEVIFAKYSRLSRNGWSTRKLEITTFHVLLQHLWYSERHKANNSASKQQGWGRKYLKKEEDNLARERIDRAGGGCGRGAGPPRAFSQSELPRKPPIDTHGRYTCIQYMHGGKKERKERKKKRKKKGEKKKSESRKVWKSRNSDKSRKNGIPDSRVKLSIKN